MVKPSLLRLNVLELVESRWAGHNQQVTEANVRSLDLANGGANQPAACAGTAVPIRCWNTKPAVRRMIAADTDGRKIASRSVGFFSRIFGSLAGR